MSEQAAVFCSAFLVANQVLFSLELKKNHEASLHDFFLGDCFVQNGWRIGWEEFRIAWEGVGFRNDPSVVAFPSTHVWKKCNAQNATFHVAWIYEHILCTESNHLSLWWSMGVACFRNLVIGFVFFDGSCYCSSCTHSEGILTVTIPKKGTCSWKQVVTGGEKGRRFPLAILPSDQDNKAVITKGDPVRR